MPETTDIEKKSLEAHVELCAERYRFLENKLENVDTKMASLSAMVREVHDMIHNMSQVRDRQIIAWGGTVLAALLGIIGYLLAVFVIK